MSRTLIHNGYVVTVNANRDVLTSGNLIIDNDKIVEIKPADGIPSEDGFDQVIDAHDCLVLPGLINMHQHHWYTLFKGLADGYLLEDWVTNFLLPLSLQLTPDAFRISGYVAAMEMLSTGTTCSLNHSVTTTTTKDVTATIEPQIEMGIRQIFAKEMRCKTPANPHHPLQMDEAIKEFEEIYNHWDGAGGGLVKLAMALECNAHWVAEGMSTEELICRGHRLANKLGIKITNHISGGTYSLEKGFFKYLRETGRTDTRYLMELGLLDPSWILIHGIHATELDLEHMALTGSSFVYTPTSEAIRGGGIAPFSNAQKLGVNTALGTDGPMVDYSVDMVEQMKVATLMQHNRHLDPTRMPVEKTIEMATINAAKALGLDDEIGSLEKGKKADIAIFDMKKPHIGVLHRPISNFICAGRGSDAKVVIVNGRVVFQDGKCAAGPDLNDIFCKAQSISRSIIEKAGLSARLEPLWRT